MAAPDPPQVLPGEEHIGHGVVVNCETIRHANFTISLKGIEMQLLGVEPMEKIKSIAVGHAMEWALEIEQGRTGNLPKNPTSYVRRCIQMQKQDEDIGEVKKAKVNAKYVPREKGESFEDMNLRLLREIEREGKR